MTVLVTGACGNVGALTADTLLARGYRVRALDLDTPANRATSARWNGRVELAWGDLRDADAVRRAVDGVTHVLHLGAVIPPVTDTDQLLGYAVNVGGTRNVIAACQAAARPPRLVFCSSPAVYGRNAEAEPPRRADEELHPEDSYGRQKVECEQMLATSGLEHAIFRLAVTPPISLGSVSPFIFDFHPDTRVELTHPRDVATALANTLLAEEVWGGVWLIGGGAPNRMRYIDFLNRSFDAMGIEPLPRSAFGPHRFYTDWLDSDPSHALLDYRRRSFEDYLGEVTGLLGPARHLVTPVRTLVRRAILASSRYESEARGRRPVVVEARRVAGLAARGARAFAPYARAWTRRYGPTRSG